MNTLGLFVVLGVDFINQKYTTAQWIYSIVDSFAYLGLDTVQITHGLWEDEHNRLHGGRPAELAAVRKMWHRADDLAQDPLLGLKMGTMQDHRSIGPLAPVIWHSSTLRNALNNIIRFQSIISEGGLYHIAYRTTKFRDKEEADSSTIVDCEYIPSYSIVPINVHHILSLITGFINLISAISNGRVKLRYITLPSSLNTRLIANKLGCKVKLFDGNISVCFECKNIDQLIPSIDPHLYQLNIAYSEALLRTMQVNLYLTNSVKDIIKKNGFSMVTIDNVESVIGLHKRIIQRQLEEQGTSFRQLKEEVLKEQSLFLLMHETLSINKVAEILKYSEPSAFHRAFKKWFGVSPKQYCVKPFY